MDVNACECWFGLKSDSKFNFKTETKFFYWSEGGGVIPLNQ